MTIYVDCHAANGGCGTKEQPFKRIQQAANIALPGDLVLVAPGIYREDVNPINAGTADAPIIYKSAVPKAAVITGAEPTGTWEKYQGDVWKLTIPNAFFTDGNPYTTLVYGDWLDMSIPAHTGEVFLGSKSLYEKTSLAEVLEPAFFDESWDRDFSKHTWYTCQSETEDATVIYANFQGKDPNAEEVSINVRSHCFWPRQTHVNYITLDGFTVTKAATQWAPPTALQEGMIGPHWSKGWVIENCDISLSKCSGISLGKYRQPGNDNKWTRYRTKDGTQTQRDCSFYAQMDGWSKETIGSHVVRGCDIHDCGQTGIVGNLGCVFSLIENNHIHHINNKHNLAGAEIGGIKFHAAIDVVIRNNHFHHCSRGIWLDWQTQGSRVSKNLFHDNCLPYDYLLKPDFNGGLYVGEDLFIEIAHGPCLVDNNILLSNRCIKLPTQGIAFVHNFFAGSITAVGRGVKNGSTGKYDSTRYTPIHVPHRTEITGVMSILHGDVRFYNNVFVQPERRPALEEMCARFNDLAFFDYQWDDGNLVAGTNPYDGYMTEDVWNSYFDGREPIGKEDPMDRYYMPLPVWTGGNVFFNGAKPADIEENGTVDTEHTVTWKLVEENGEIRFVTNCIPWLPEAQMISTETLGMAFEPEERFEEPNGDPIVFDTDIYGRKRPAAPVAGPIIR